MGRVVGKCASLDGQERVFTNEHLSLLWVCLSFSIAFFGRLPWVDRFVSMPVACGSGVRGFVVLGCLWDEAQVIRLSHDIDRDQHVRNVRAVNSASSCQTVGNTFRHLRAMDEILHGTVWRMISRWSTTDEVVRCRTVTSRWNLQPPWGDG